MAMKLITVLCSILAIWAVQNVDSASPPHAPTPAVDCSTLVMNMADCLSFVTNGSTVRKPEGTCCSGLKTVLKANADCLCEAFKSSAQLGVTLNITKAMTLPSACHVSAPSVSNCALSGAPGAAPAASPTIALAPSSVAGAPTSTAGSAELAPAPTPGISASSALSISLGALLATIVFAASMQCSF